MGYTNELKEDSSLQATERTFYVERANKTIWSDDRFYSLEDATNYARSQAWKAGEDFMVFKAVAKVEKPEAVNNTKVTELS